MYGRQSSRMFDNRNAYFRPIADDEMAVCSSLTGAPVSVVHFTTTSTASASSHLTGSNDLLHALHKDALEDRERMQLVHEFILSERSYVDDLETINTVFLQPLRKRRVLPESEVGRLFSTLPAIISLNKALLSAVVGSYTQAEAHNRSIDAAVTAAIQKGCCSAIMTARGLTSLASVKRKECLIADAFQQMASYLKVYETYSTRYADAVAIIKNNRANNPTFGAFLDEVQSAPECGGRDMKTLLLRPVQRLCQYISILEDLVRCTPRSHGDYDLLVQTGAKVQDIARGAEESLFALQLAAKDSDVTSLSATPSSTTTTTPTTTTTKTTTATTTTLSASTTTKPLRTSSGSSGGSRRRKISVTADDRPRERRRDSLADMPEVWPADMPNPTAEAGVQQPGKQEDPSKRPRRQVSWRFSLSRIRAPLKGDEHSKSHSVGDLNCASHSESGESLMSLLDRERRATFAAPEGSTTTTITITPATPPAQPTTHQPSAGGDSDSDSCTSTNGGQRRSTLLRRGGSLTRVGSTSKAACRSPKSKPRRVNSTASLCRSESATGSTFKGGLVC